MNSTKRRNVNFKKILSGVIILAVLVATCVTMLLGCGQDEQIIDTGDFSVHFIDVGQGDCTLIKTTKGNMLIDAGDNGNEQTILNYLDEQGVTSLEYFVVTHSHVDHIGGAAEIINNLEVENIVLSAYSDHDTKTYENMLEAIVDSDANRIKAQPGSEYTMGDVTFTILSPFNDDNELNNTSVTLKLTYGEHSFMFTGDAEKEVEEQLIEAGYDLSADVFKAAHHGSTTSNTEDFIDAINPSIAVISVGAGNDYGHPDDEVLSRFDERGIEYYTTSNSGNIIIKVDGEELSVICEKE